MSFVELFSDYTFRTVFFGTMGIGAVSGMVGCFAYLRRQSLVGDVVSHSSLLGIMLFFLLGYWMTGEGSKSLFLLIPGAIAAGMLALIFVRLLVKQTPVREDSGLGVMLALFFGTGIMILKWVQKSNPPIPGRGGLEDYLFGMAAAMTRNDLWMIAILGVGSLLILGAFWKQFKVYSFDPLLTQSLGFRTGLLDTLLIAILVVGIVIGIQSIGVVLMIAMLVTPAAAARQWTRTLGQMVGASAIIGAGCAGVGTIISAEFGGLPTGPLIVLTGTCVFLVSLVFAPGRGVLAGFIRRRLLGSQIKSNQGA